MLNSLFKKKKKKKYVGGGGATEIMKWILVV